ncbi:MAG: diacylglycerol kinase [Gammaproteobacteria bacterium]|nr:diacylglycerol kinase [Gammaproteobacteria bacterium]
MKNLGFDRRMGFAVQGWRHAWRHEYSFRTQVFAALLVFALLAVLRPHLVWWALVGVMVSLVLAAELFNTALENLADIISPQAHPAIKIAKDCAAGAVLVLSAGAVWVAVLMVLAQR